MCTESYINCKLFIINILLCVLGGESCFKHIYGERDRDTDGVRKKETDRESGWCSGCLVGWLVGGLVVWWLQVVGPLTTTAINNNIQQQLTATTRVEQLIDIYMYKHYSNKAKTKCISVSVSGGGFSN